MPYVFGIHAVESILINRPSDVICLFLKQNRTDKRKEKLYQLASAKNINIQICSINSLNEMVSEKHQGAIVQIKEELKENSSIELDLGQLTSLIEKAEGKALILILDGITDPQNLGACLRTSDAAGVTAVVIPKNKSVGITPVVRKVACGAVEVLSLIHI